MNRIVAIFALLLCAIPAAADQVSPKNSRDKTQFFHDIIIEPNDTANVVQCFGCNVYVRGHVTGDIVTGGGSIYISGPVDGVAFAFGGHVEVRSGGELRGDAVAIGGYVVASGQGKLDRHAVSTPYAIVPGQYRPTAVGIIGLVVLHLLCVALAGALLRAKRIDNTAWTIWNRKNMVLVTGGVALLIGWGLESLCEYLGRAENAAYILLALVVILIGSAGATGLGRLVGGVAFPSLAPFRAVLAGIFALTMLEVIPVFGFFVFSIGLLIALGATIVSGFGARAVPSEEELAHPQS
ncbi:MAG: hypothetical protein ACRD59_18985 [Candidatus Acidiferrales bacterium]